MVVRINAFLYLVMAPMALRTLGGCQAFEIICQKISMLKRIRSFVLRLIEPLPIFFFVQKMKLKSDQIVFIFRIRFSSIRIFQWKGFEVFV